MKKHVSPEVQRRVHEQAVEIYREMVTGYSFDGRELIRDVEVSIADTIIERMASPEDLLRVKLRYPEDGPDDRWRAACELLLGGGLVHQDRRFRVLGAGSGLKDGAVWMATDALREKLHHYFSTSQEALTYSGAFFSRCPNGVWPLDGVRGRVVEDGEYGTADGMGFICPELVKRLGLPTRQAQVRLVSDVDSREWLGKGTLIPRELPDGLELLIPISMVKGKGRPQGQRWDLWFGVRDIAKTRPYGSSYTFAQWFGEAVFDVLQEVRDRKLARLKRALASREDALEFLGLSKGDGELEVVRTTAEAFLATGLSPDHPWLRRQLNQLLRSAWLKLALGGPFKMEGRMGAWADLPEDTVCTVDLPAGPLVLTRYPIRDPRSIRSVVNDPQIVDSALPGTIYLNADLATQLDGDFDGDYYVTNSQKPVVEAVRASNWWPEYKREDVPPKRRLRDPLSNLPWVAVSSLGNRIGTITLVIAGAVHAGNYELVAPLSAALQSEVQSLKWDSRGDRQLVDEAMKLIPEYLTLPKQDRTHFVDHAEEVEGETALVHHYNAVVASWRKSQTDATPLAHHKSAIPLWTFPKSLDFIEETIAVVQTYNRWIGSILAKVDEPTSKDLQGPLDFLRAWSESKTDNRLAWAVALWHAVHTSRSEASTGSAAFHAFTDEMLALISENSKLNVEVQDPRSSAESLLAKVETIPLVGGLAAAGDKANVFRQRLAKLHGNVAVQTRQNGGVNAAFWFEDLYIGQVPQDHPLYGSIPVGLIMEGRFNMRGRTVYMFIESEAGH